MLTGALVCGPMPRLQLARRRHHLAARAYVRARVVGRQGVLSLPALLAFTSTKVQILTPEARSCVLTCVQEWSRGANFCSVYLHFLVQKYKYLHLSSCMAGTEHPHLAPRLAHQAACFTCFTSTKVQILTPAALRGRHRASTSGSATCAPSRQGAPPQSVHSVYLSVYSVYLLYQHKGTNTDGGGARQLALCAMQTKGGRQAYVKSHLADAPFHARVPANTRDRADSSALMCFAKGVLVQAHVQHTPRAGEDTLWGGEPSDKLEAMSQARENEPSLEKLYLPLLRTPPSLSQKGHSAEGQESEGRGGGGGGSYGAGVTGGGGEGDDKVLGVLAVTYGRRCSVYLLY
jgi:hypothetical protein